MKPYEMKITEHNPSPSFSLTVQYKAYKNHQHTHLQGNVLPQFIKKEERGNGPLSNLKNVRFFQWQHPQYFKSVYRWLKPFNMRPLHRLEDPTVFQQVPLYREQNQIQQVGEFPSLVNEEQKINPGNERIELETEEDRSREENIIESHIGQEIISGEAQRRKRKSKQRRLHEQWIDLIRLAGYRLWAAAEFLKEQKRKESYEIDNCFMRFSNELLLAERETFPGLKIKQQQEESNLDLTQEPRRRNKNPQYSFSKKKQIGLINSQ